MGVKRFPVGNFFVGKGGFMKGYPWVRLYLDDIEMLLSIQPFALKVFFCLVKRMNEYGYVYMSPKQIGKLTDTPKGTVSKALDLLKKGKFIEGWDKNVYRVNPRYIQVGKKRKNPEVPGLIDLATGEVRRFKLFKRTGEAK